jgi:rhodanese-related sulfurtransferase
LKYGLIIGIIFITLLTANKWKSISPLLGKGDNAFISVESLKERITTKTPIMVDVRTEGEYFGNLGHIEGSILIPLNELSNRILELEKYKSKEIIMVCRSGNRSGQATKFLNNNGYNALNMIGGMIKWNSIK